MSATIYPIIHNSIAETIVRDIVTKNAKYYYFLGKTLPYNSGVEVVELPTNDYKYELKTRLEMIELKEITSNDVSYVIPRIDWVSGTVYDHYDDAEDISNKQFYVITSDYNVYKCLDNNYGAASIKMPSGHDTAPFYTIEDGYKWKFMFTIPLSLRAKFMTNAYIPVTTAFGSSFYNNGGIDIVSIENGGTGYDPNVNPVTITVQSSTGGTGAQLSPVVSNGSIVDVIIDNPGEGYTYADITVFGNAVDDTDAIITATFNQGSINTIQADVELLATEGTIEYIKVVDQGYNYGNVTVVIDGDGVEASAEAVVVDTRIVGINIINSGHGYTYATVTLIGSGTGASARAIMSPKGGHGKNAVNELYADTLMFFSNISTERNNGFTLSNDFRQFGIIKNPTKFDSTVPFSTKFGSTCFTLYGTVDTTKFLTDDELHDNDWNKYKIVAVESAGILVQSINNTIPISGATLVNNRNGEGFLPLTVTMPQVNKYSGKLLYVDNRAAFYQTEDQSITLQTVIKF